MLWIQEKTSSPEQLWDAESFLGATGRKERSVSWSCVFITGGGEVLTAERLLSSTFGLTSSLCLDKLDWESFHSQSAQCAMQSHFSTSLKSRRELQSSFPLAPNQSAPTGCSQPGTPQGHIHSCEQPLPTRAPRRPLCSAVGTQIPTARGVAHVWSSHCVMSATQSANASGWILAWTLQREAKIRAYNMEICNILCTWGAQCIPTQML